MANPSMMRYGKRLQQHAIHERARITLVTVADHILDRGCLLPRQPPLRCCRKTRAPASAQAGFFDCLDQFRHSEFDRLRIAFAGARGRRGIGPAPRTRREPHIRRCPGGPTPRSPRWQCEPAGRESRKLRGFADRPCGSSTHVPVSSIRTASSARFQRWRNWRRTPRGLKWPRTNC